MNWFGPEFDQSGPHLDLVRHGYGKLNAPLEGIVSFQIPPPNSTTTTKQFVTETQKWPLDKTREQPVTRHGMRCSALSDIVEEVQCTLGH